MYPHGPYRPTGGAMRNTLTLFERSRRSDRDRHSRSGRKAQTVLCYYTSVDSGNAGHRHGRAATACGDERPGGSNGMASRVCNDRAHRRQTCARTSSSNRNASSVRCGTSLRRCRVWIRNRWSSSAAIAMHGPTVRSIRSAATSTCCNSDARSETESARLEAAAHDRDRFVGRRGTNLFGSDDWVDAARSASCAPVASRT